MLLEEENFFKNIFLTRSHMDIIKIILCPKLDLLRSYKTESLQLQMGEEKARLSSRLTVFVFGPSNLSESGKVFASRTVDFTLRCLIM